MKGKKRDSEYISLFISESIKLGFSTPSEILNRAEVLINSIDEQIKEIENSKKIRSKLLDVTEVLKRCIC